MCIVEEYYDGFVFEVGECVDFVVYIGQCEVVVELCVVGDVEILEFWCVIVFCEQQCCCECVCEYLVLVCVVFEL